LLTFAPCALCCKFESKNLNLNFCLFVSDIAVFVLKRDVKLQLTNFCLCTKQLTCKDTMLFFAYRFVAFPVRTGSDGGSMHIGVR